MKPLLPHVLCALFGLIASRSLAADFVLIDGNSTAVVTTGEPSGMYNWTIDGQSALYRKWFYFVDSLPGTNVPKGTFTYASTNRPGTVRMSDDNASTEITVTSDWKMVNWTVAGQNPNTNVLNPDDLKTKLLFSFFRDNGQAGLFLATSDDGLKWTEITPPGKSFIQPQLADKLMRDPCIALGRDGTFHMVWTCGWGKPAVIGIAHSKDLIHWSEQKAVPVMEKEPEAKNAWAPEIFYDEAKSQWLIFWSTTIPGKFPETENSGDNNHRIYCTTTRDFTTYTPTTLLYDGGFNVIDATLLPARGKFYLVVKDETKNPVKKHLRLAVSDHADGPFSQAGPPITGDWVEGPSAIQIGDEYFIYFDHYSKPQYYSAAKSSDLEHWTEIASQISFPKGVRHGTVLKVPGIVIHNLQSSAAK